MGWSCGFSPVIERGLRAQGTAATFEKARADFETAWLTFLPLCIDADFEAYRRQQAWTRWKYSMYDAGCMLADPGGEREITLLLRRRDRSRLRGACLLPTYGGRAPWSDDPRPSEILASTGHFSGGAATRTPYVAIPVSVGNGGMGASGRHGLLAVTSSAQLLAGLVVVAVHRTAQGSGFGSRKRKNPNYG